MIECLFVPVGVEGDKMRWKLVWELLEEYRWERWHALLAELAEYLCAKLDLAPPSWSEDCVLRCPWFRLTVAVESNGH